MAIKLLITDLDNTLYDWVAFYIPSFLAMIDELSALTGIPQEQLKASFKRVHEKHRCTEYSFAIEELDVLQDVDRALSVPERLSKYALAIDAFRQQRNKLLRLYDGVPETLSALRNRGILIAALTDATTYYATRRLKQLGIESQFDILCATADHGIPEGVPVNAVRSLSPAEYKSQIPLVIPSVQFRKPDKQLVNMILDATKTEPHEALVVGDSIYRDIKMAQDAGAWDGLAEYGANLEKKQYEELLKITYWTAADVAEYDRLRQGIVHPSFALKRFGDALQIVDFIDAQVEAGATRASPAQGG